MGRHKDSDVSGTIFEVLQNKNVLSTNSVISEEDVKLVVVSFKLPIKYKKVLEERAEKQGISLSTLIRNAIDAYMGNDKTKPMKVGKLKIYS